MSDFQYPFAASPDIIRSHQKDAYFTSTLSTHLSTILRNIYGARFSHTYNSEARVFAELLYLGLTTLVGNRTLGEEYCDIVQVEDDERLRLPSVGRRAGYILGSILVPYGLGRILPGFRRKAREKLEKGLRRRGKTGSAWTRKMQTYVLENLDTITSPSPVYAISLAVFYFSGAYYHLGKRIWGLRYIFTRKMEPSDQRVGYEVLGVLLVLQMAVQAYLHLHSTASGLANSGMSAPEGLGGGSAILEGGVEVSLDPNAYSSNNAILFESGVPTPQVNKEGLQKITHTPALEQPRYSLKDKDVMRWMEGRQQRKCTLCLEEMKDPSVTTCGHVFCWICITDWCREKPECPLCRQISLVQHILPLRGGE
ncbi:MAG: peroxisome biogenesis factor 10 [Bogoriella megaspora]|nr:MAG: peroxisome biogenesis factor 10 [Bogoriella megaspora]